LLAWQSLDVMDEFLQACGDEGFGVMDGGIAMGVIESFLARARF